MQTWFGKLPRTSKGRKSSKKDRRARSEWRSKFEALNFNIERLEDRVFLAADLGIDKSVVPVGSVLPGELLTYTIHVFNTAGAGVTAATGVVVTDPLPAGETFVDATVTTSGAGTPTVSNTGNVVTASLGTLDAGVTDTITIQALVNTDAGGGLTNTASLTNTSGDVDPAPASASNDVGLPVITSTVNVTKTVTPTGAVTLGSGPLTYSVTISNAAASGSVSNIDLIDQLPANESFVSAKDAAGDSFTATGNTITGTLGTALANGSSDVVTIVANPTAIGPAINTALIAVPTGNTGTATATASNTFVTAANTVSVSKASVPANAIGTVGAPLTYNVTITNGGAGNVSSVVLLDRLDTNEMLVGTPTDTNHDTFTATAGAITG
ncbi:MAG: hypothetical protein ACRD4G_08660, partial [Bryobacteraceae bacterium]